MFQSLILNKQNCSHLALLRNEIRMAVEIFYLGVKKRHGGGQMKGGELKSRIFSYGHEFDFTASESVHSRIQQPRTSHMIAHSVIVIIIFKHATARIQ